VNIGNPHEMTILRVRRAHPRAHRQLEPISYQPLPGRRSQDPPARHHAGPRGARLGAARRARGRPGAHHRLLPRVEIADARRLLLDSGRRNDKRPAYVQLAVPDEMVKDLRGRPEKADALLLVRLPREVVDRLESRIVLPGEA
jgi:hypothetical protein